MGGRISDAHVGLYSFAVEPIGVEERGKYHQKHNTKENPEAAEEACQHDHKSTDQPEPTGKAVGPVPVFLAVKRPGNLDADGVILLTLG